MIARAILCIRHAQSAFNAAFEETGINLLFNRLSTLKGEAQVLLAGRPERRTAMVGAMATFFCHLTSTFLPNSGMTRLEMETA